MTLLFLGNSTNLRLNRNIENYKYDKSTAMDLNEVIKALGNPVRMEIVRWLKNPKVHFDVAEQLVDADKEGVCVSIIQEKAGLSQSTVSVYLSALQRAGLVKSNRIGAWTYYQRDEANIQRFLSLLGADL